LKSYTEVELIVVRQAFCKTNYPDFQYIGQIGTNAEVKALTTQVEMSGQTLLDLEPSMNLETKWWQSLQTGEATFSPLRNTSPTHQPLLKNLNASIEVLIKDSDALGICARTLWQTKPKRAESFISGSENFLPTHLMKPERAFSFLIPYNQISDGAQIPCALHVTLHQ
jgi:hypothetical protein